MTCRPICERLPIHDRRSRFAALCLALGVASVGASAGETLAASGTLASAGNRSAAPGLSPHPVGRLDQAPQRLRYRWEHGALQALPAQLQTLPGAPPAPGPGQPAPQLTAPPGSAAAQLAFGFDNTCQNASFFYPGPGTSQMDWGVYAPLPGEVGLVYSFEVGYVTSSTVPVQIDVGLWAGTSGSCSAGDTSAPLANFALTGLPASTTGMPEGFLVTVETPTLGLVLPPGPIGWDYEMFDALTGPILTDGPLGSCGSGSVDAYDEYTPSAGVPGSCSTLFFGGCAPVFACASFYLGVVTDDGSPPASLTLRPGCSALNAAGAMTAVSGPPSISIGAALQFAVDPSLPAPGAPALAPGQTLVISWLATAPDVFTAYPCGTPLTGILPPYYGELLISILGNNPIVQTPLGGALWSGTPVSVVIPVPTHTFFVGFPLFAQSTMTDLVTGATVLTESWDIVVGP